MTDSNTPTDNGGNKGGRPQVNRDLAFQLLQKGYSTKYIMRVLKCSSRTIRMLKKEMRTNGTKPVTKDDAQWMQAEAELDEESERATGIKYSEWLKSKTVAWKSMLSFTDEIWNKVMDKVSLLILRDATNPIGDKITLKVVQQFNDNSKTSREKIVRIRYLYRFLGRADLLEKYLRVSETRHPKAKREVSVIMSTDFPIKLERCFVEMSKQLGSATGTMMRLKLASMMRTGSENKELWGLRKDESHPTHLIMHNQDEFSGQILAKRNEKWSLNWLPKPLLKELWEYYQTLPQGARYMPLGYGIVLKTWQKITKEIIGTPLRLHDLRKVSITWLWCMRIPLEIGTDINVGWKDLNTAKNIYLTNKRLIKREQRQAYRANIPEWFKEGLDQFRDDEK